MAREARAALTVKRRGSVFQAQKRDHGDLFSGSDTVQQCDTPAVRAGYLADLSAELEEISHDQPVGPHCAPPLSDRRILPWATHLAHVEVLFQSHAGRVADVTSPGRAPAAHLRPVVIDPAARRFLLVPNRTAAPVTWSVPAHPMQPGESLYRAAARCLRRELRLPALRIAAVTGRLPASDQRRYEEYFVLVAPAVMAWPCGVRLLLAPDARWWTTAELRDTGVRVEPEALLDLIDGYWEGWLPDGVIALA